MGLALKRVVCKEREQGGEGGEEEGKKDWDGKGVES